MAYITVEIKIPEEMKPFVEEDGSEDILLRNALLLYPYIINRKISHGRAAEILGIRKLELIEMYGKLGFPYFDHIMDDLDKDMETFQQLGLDKAVTI